MVPILRLLALLHLVVQVEQEQGVLRSPLVVLVVVALILVVQTLLEHRGKATPVVHLSLILTVVAVVVKAHRADPVITVQALAETDLMLNRHGPPQQALESADTMEAVVVVVLTQALLMPVVLEVVVQHL